MVNPSDQLLILGSSFLIISFCSKSNPLNSVLSHPKYLHPSSFMLAIDVNRALVLRFFHFTSTFPTQHGSLELSNATLIAAKSSWKTSTISLSGRLHR